MTSPSEDEDFDLLTEANRLRQVVEHLHAVAHSQMGAAETVRQFQLILAKAMREAKDFPPAVFRSRFR